MSDVAPLRPDEERLLRAMGSAFKQLLHALDEDLVREQGMSSVEYDVLRYLSEARGRAMRLSELALRCNQSASGMSRTVDRLERSGWVRREQCATDRRGLLAVLTGTGLARLEEAWLTALGSARRHIFDKLEGVDLAPVTEAMERLGDQRLG